MKGHWIYHVISHALDFESLHLAEIGITIYVHACRHAFEEVTKSEQRSSNTWHTGIKWPYLFA